MIKFDYHMHSNHSADCGVSMKTMIKQAIALGLTEIAITDHIDFTFPDNEIISPYGIDANVKAMRAIRDKYADEITVRIGMELSLRPDSAAACAAAADSHDFDIIIGAAHDIKGIDFYYPELYRKNPKHAAYMIYFENLLACVRTCDCFDVLAHFDYVVRYAARHAAYADASLDYAEFSGIIDDILRAVIQSGRGIEINTSGLAYGLGHAHPIPPIIARYVRLGGEIITVGSDAHSPARIALGFDTALEILRDCGAKYICRFEGRKPQFVKI